MILRDRIECIVFDNKLRDPQWQKLDASEDLLRLEIEKQFDRFATEAMVTIAPLDDDRIPSNALDSHNGPELTGWQDDRFPLRAEILRIISEVAQASDNERSRRGFMVAASRGRRIARK